MTRWNEPPDKDDWLIGFAAEIERLQAVIADQPRDMQIADRFIKDLHAQIERLRAENQDHIEAVCKAAAEIERLTADRAQLVLMTEVQRASNREIERLLAELERLQAENARLKEIEIKYDQFISGAFV